MELGMGSWEIGNRRKVELNERRKTTNEKRLKRNSLELGMGSLETGNRRELN